MTAGRGDGFVARVLPKRTLLRNGLLSFVLISVPLFGSLYLLGVPNGTWTLILAAQSLSILLFLIAVVRYRMTFVGVTDSDLVERGFLSRMTRVSRDRVDAVVLVETYRTNAPDTVPQLLVTDVAGARALRMRGTFWSEKNMREIAAALERPLDYYPDPITTQEFFTAYPTSAYWFENRRSLVALSIVLVFAASLAAVLGLMSLAGIPLAG